MEKNDQWELQINTAGDTSGNQLFLNGKRVLCTEVSLDVDSDNVPLLNISVPIIDNNLALFTSSEPPKDEIIEATAKDKNEQA